MSVPPQVFEVTAAAPGVIRRPSGKTSMKLSPDKGTGALLVIVKTTTTLVPGAAVLGLKLLVNIGAAKGPGGKPIMLGEGLGVGRGGIVGAEGGGTRGLG